MNRLLPLRVTALALLAAAAFSSCDSQKAAERPNIVLVVIDSARPDRMSVYGNDAVATPYLTELAAHAVVFRRAYSTSSWAAPAAASLLTSVYPVQHGVHRGVLATRTLQEIEPRVELNRVPDGLKTMAEVLKEAGYSTWGVSDDIDVGPALGFDRGFDRFEHLEELGAPRVNAVVESWAGEIAGAGPYFLYIHYSDPRRPYITRAPWYTPKHRERDDAVAAYDSEVSYVDQHIGELAKLLGWDRNTWVIVTSVHGEELRDHGDWYHGRTLYREVLNVPLIVSFPAEHSRPRRIEEPVSIIDVLPTVREIAGLPPGPAERGVSLVPTTRGEAVPPLERVLFADLRSAPWFGSLELKAAVRANAKYIWTLPDREELFNTSADPKEMKTLAWNRPELMAELRAEIERLEAESPRYGSEPLRVPVDAQTVERLRSAVYAN